MKTFAFLFIFAAALQAQQPAPADPVPIISRVLVDSSFAQFFQNARDRQNGHKTLPDQEYVACIYGLVRGDTAMIGFMRPTFSNAMGAGQVSYEHCPQPNPRVMGENLRLLGTWHPHGPDSLREGGCYFSTTDDQSFTRTEDVILEFVTCKQKTIWRSKYK